MLTLTINNLSCNELCLLVTINIYTNFYTRIIMHLILRRICWIRTLSVQFTYVFAWADDGLNLHILGICLQYNLYLMLQNGSVFSLNKKISSTNNWWYSTCIVFLFTQHTSRISLLHYFSEVIDYIADVICKCWGFHKFKTSTTKYYA